MRLSTRSATLSAMLAVLMGASACSSDGAGASEEGSGASEGSFKKQTFTYTSPFAPGGLNTGLETWSESLKDQTDGAITVDIHYSESLVSGFETLAAISNSTADLGAIPPSYNPSELPLANVLSIPFQTENALAQMWTFYEMVRENDQLRTQYENNNIHVLMVQPSGGGAVGLSDPIDDHTGLDGKRLRAIGFVVPGLTSLGAESVAINPGEIYEAIQRDVVDGYGGYVFDNLDSLGLHEVAPNTYDIGIGQYSAQVIGINLDLWNSLDPELQELMTTEAERFMTEDAPQVLARFEEETCDAILESGGSMTVLPDDDLSQIRETVGDGPAEEWVRAATGAGVTEAEAREFHQAWLDRLETNEEKFSDYTSGMRACADR